VLNGRAVKTVARFRAYGSYAESFADYARLMKESPRYQQVLRQGQDASSFAAGLQRAGYATDPDYADKLTRIINTTLRIQRAAI
jgi:flagellar protein FlgJ